MCYKSFQQEVSLAPFIGGGKGGESNPVDGRARERTCTANTRTYTDETLKMKIAPLNMTFNQELLTL